jgi:MoxR-like ATPase
VAVPALAHRLILRPEFWAQELSEERVVAEILDQVPTPPARPTDRMP